MGLYGNMRPLDDTIYGMDQMKVMYESSILARISTYAVKNKLIAVLEVKSQEMVTIEATMFDVHKESGQNG